MTNLQGDVIGIEDATGNQVAHYTYDAWGNNLEISGWMGTLNPLRYRGYVYDQETGLYYLESRYYDPATGRFLNADSYTATKQNIVGHNMFAYCENNPVTFQDSQGDIALFALKMAIISWKLSYISDCYKISLTSFPGCATMKGQTA